MKRIKIEEGLAAKISPAFKEKFEEAIPMWVKTLLPYYEEGLAQGVDIMALTNYLPVGDQGPLYEKDGIGYFLHEGSSTSILGFNSKYKYIRCNWEDYFSDFYPEYYDKEHEIERIDNSFYLNWYLWRLFNKKEGYDSIARQVDDYFKELTGNPNAGLSFSSTSMIYYNLNGRMHIENWYSFS